MGTWLEPAPKRRRTTRFRIATVNALGDSHTRPGGNKAGRGWLQSARRTVLLTRVILARRLSVVGLQEFQAPQQRTWRSRLNPLWRMHAIKDNAVVWVRARWRLVDKGALTVPYFHGKPKPMPWVVLRDRRTGKRIAVMSTHNPANVRGPAQRWRDEGWDREIDWALEMSQRPDIAAAFIVGDKNDKLDYQRLVEANGGRIAGVPASLPNTPGNGIDWIVGWGDVRFANHRTSKTRRIARMTDHPVEQATAIVGGKGRP